MILLLLAVIYIFLISPKNQANQWQKIQSKGYLTWITRPSPLTYYNSLDGFIGLEYDIINRFCKKYNLELKVITTSSNGELFKLFNTNNIDILGANLTLTEERKKNYIASIDYDETFTRLISSYRKPKIKSIDNLHNYNGIALNNSSYEDIAISLVEKFNANIEIVDGKSLYELLQDVLDDKKNYTIADSNVISIYESYIPKLRLGFKLSEINKLVFFTPKGFRNSKMDYSLAIKLDEYISEYKSRNLVNEYKKVILDTLPRSKPADTVFFLKNYKKRWPLIKSVIYSTAKKFEISPTLLGAISYQESHWNGSAVSPTLVKGLMMLTKDVAKEQNVTDRNDILQSLEGGTKHFIKMKNKIPKRIIEPNLTNFALASYNIGYGNLEKARVITQKAGANPDLWNDVKEYLPELNKIDSYRVDGITAVRYVENIHVYQNLLHWKEQQ